MKNAFTEAQFREAYRRIEALAPRVLGVHFDSDATSVLGIEGEGAVLVPYPCRFEISVTRKDYMEAKISSDNIEQLPIAIGFIETFIS